MLWLLLGEPCFGFVVLSRHSGTLVSPVPWLLGVLCIDSSHLQIQKVKQQGIEK